MQPPPTAFDAITRDAILRRIRWLSRTFELQWIVDQAIFNVANIHMLDDAALARLLTDMERARECPLDDVAFEDAGLIRNTAATLQEP